MSDEPGRGSSGTRRLLKRTAFVLLLLVCAALWRAAGQAAVVTQPTSEPTTVAPAERS